jgi:lipopolysaccharide/colanic/teichoic acid biosynthesis glycosyltransferase
MVRRGLDLTICAILLVPALISLSLLIVITILKQGRPILYSQQRVGRFERVFMLYKLRSMSNSRDACGELLPDEARLTSWGRFLRESSLDELPQLWNVVRGDMSFVGPRPLPVRYLPRYNAEQRHRHVVRPGITGWAQVNGRNNLSWEAKFELDVWYVEHQSIKLDIKILWMTTLRVLRREGINSDGHATMPEFLGEQK